MSDAPRQLNCTITSPDGSLVPAGTLAYTDLQVDDPTLDGGIRYGGRIEEPGRFIIRFPGCAPKGQGANLAVKISGAAWSGRIVTPSQGSHEMGEEGGDSIIALVKTKDLAPFKRSGIVRASGRCWMDDSGAWYPLGHTLFWAPRGWKFERDRIKQNIQFLIGRGDYIRVLGMVGWTGNEIDPTWPDYQQVFGELIDYCYDECGLRVQITVTGGGPWDAVECARKLAPVIAARPEKIIKLEAANEGYNNSNPAEMDAIARILKQAAPKNLVALSAPIDSVPATVEEHMTDANANMVTLHFERTYGDEGWRHVRQGWDAKGAHYPVSSNEPIGPASSVASEVDPLRLAMNRATSIMCNAEDYVFHSGAGIFGVPGSGSGVPRTANLWEMPDIETIMDAVQKVDQLLPKQIGNWTCANDGWVPPNPVAAFHSLDGGEVGPIKNYCARNYATREFIQMPHGIKGHYRASANEALECNVYDPLTHDLIATARLNAGEEIRLPGSPHDRQCAYIIVGRFL